MNTKHEEHIIGGLIKGVITTADVRLLPSDFDELGAVYSIIRELEQTKTEVSPETLYQRTGEIDSLGWFSASDFKRMADAPVSGSSCIRSARLMRQSTLKDELTTKTAELFLDTEKISGAELLEKMSNLVESNKTEFSEVRQGFKHVGELMPKVLKVYEDLNSGVSYSVATGFKQIDDAILDGFSRGDEHLIVGFTGAGKSSLAMTFALNQAQRGEVVGIISKEMSDVENLIRMQSSLTKTPRWFIRKGLHDADYQKLVRHSEDFSRLPIFINTETTTVEDFRADIKELVETQNLSIVYVDYLQLMSSSENHSSRANEIQQISRTLKLIAMENNIPVVSLCQFNRKALNVSVFEIMYQLKESSGLEQDASTILFVEVEQTQEKKQIKDASVTVLKNRNGTPFVPIELEFQGELFTFREKNL